MVMLATMTLLNRNRCNEMEKNINDINSDPTRKAYYFRCSECHYRERIIGDIDAYLEDHLSSTGCCKGCGTQKWGVVDNNGEMIC